MRDRRQIFAGLGVMALASAAPKSLWAASMIKVDDGSALLVIDVQNCFLPGGSLAVKDGDQVIPVINRLAKGFANVILTQDWHTEGHTSFASAHPGKKPFETIDLAYGKQVLWPDHCVQGTDGAALSKDRQRLVCRDHVRLVRVVLGDVRGEVGLADRRAEHLAHLSNDDRGQLLATLPMELGRAADQPGPLGDRERPPGLEREARL